jgi:DNA-binding response OmpR family regulator
MVATTLRRSGFQVDTAESGESALKHIHENGLPNLAIVDINMPMGMDGFEFCEAVLEFSDLPIIMLTAVEESETIIQTIEQYAEDYITKPVGTGELVARVRRLLRSLGQFAYDLKQFTQIDNRLEINFATQIAKVNNEPVTLTPTETKLLYILMRSAGQLVYTDFLIKRLWPKEDAFEDRLRVYIHRLRNKIEEEPNNPRYIVSQRRKGYVFLPNGT